ncbi:MAG: hypothetical protein IH811_12615 [Proteobacteria bacterium]|nr:hypothetical protein [Pseudomonadota bacterium]
MIDHRWIIDKIVNVQLTIIFDRRIIPRLAYRAEFGTDRQISGCSAAW